MKIVLLLCIIFSVGAYADKNSEIKDRVEKVLNNSGIDKSKVGISVVDSAKNTVFNLNASKNFIPASITKLLTSGAVLHGLLPGYRCHTQIFIDGERAGTTLKGNIYLKGMGDPAFVSEKMWMIVNDFSRTGIKKITGQIIVDDSYFDDERIDPDREIEISDRAYDAPVGALSFNWNSTTIHVQPGREAGDKALVWIDPENEMVSLVNELKTSIKGTDIHSFKKTVGERDIITVSGKISMGSEEKHIYKSITNPPIYTAANFREFLKQRQIEVVGGVARGVVPSSAKIMVDQESEQLSYFVTAMNKFSNNFIAEMLAKNLAAEKVGTPAHLKDANELVRKFLESELDFDRKQFNLVSVSGLSRRNSFQAKHFTDFLHWIKSQFRIFPEFLQSLPIGGVDGTLEKRMKGTAAENWVRAKTGLLNGVVALSGYAGRPKDEEILFAFIYNGKGDEGHVRQTFDKMAAALVK